MCESETMSLSTLSVSSLSDCLVLGWVPGTMELLIIAGIALLLFGHRLPSVMRNLGRGVVEFKKGVHDVGNDDEEEDAPAVNKSAATSESSVPKG